MEYTIIPIIDKNNQIIYFESIGRDITERKELGEKLKESNQILENIFAVTHFQLVLLDKNFNFIKVNDAYAQTCGFPKDFFIGKNHFELYPDDENQQIFQRVVDTGTNMKNGRSEVEGGPRKLKDVLCSHHKLLAAYSFYWNNP